PARWSLQIALRALVRQADDASPMRACGVGIAHRPRPPVGGRRPPDQAPPARRRSNRRHSTVFRYPTSVMRERRKSMRRAIRASLVAIAGLMAAPAIISAAMAGEDRTRDTGRSAPATNDAKPASAASTAKPDENPPEINLLDAMRKGQVHV